MPHTIIHKTNIFVLKKNINILGCPVSARFKLKVESLTATHAFPTGLADIVGIDVDADVLPYGKPTQP